MTKRVRWKVGNVVKVPLEDGRIGYGRILEKPLIAVYDYVSTSETDVETVLSQPVKYILAVMKYAVTSGRWTVIGHANLNETLQKPVPFFRQNILSGKLTIDLDGVEYPATIEDCLGLERNAVWDPEHVESRILDEINGCENIWVKSLKLKLN